MPKHIDSWSWRENAECAKPENSHLKPFFFSDVPREKYDARNLCYTCDVRKDCLKYALENKELWGVWGGKDEADIRRALSVSHEGKEIRRTRFPNCPYCGARPGKLTVIVAPTPEGGRWSTMKLVQCTACEFTWRSRTSANAVTAYHAGKKKSKKPAGPQTS
jgi:WhiB family redox-sensing transcriptional regulator